MEQLMELAGLSVAAAVCAEFPAASHPRVLVVCGPGNNGGDGLVAARHLRHFGYTPTVLYPRTPAKPLFAGLVTQLNSLGVPFLAPERFTEEFLAARSCDLVVDAIFGFSFAGPPRAPFDRILELLTQTRADLLPPILSVDVPSGWPVDRAPTPADGALLAPAVLVSLTAPKLCVAGWTKPHYLGGRFVPPSVAAAYGLSIPAYSGADQIARL
eukprot:TRINITY_DN1324_c0_g1_i1.p2 TRINITY_DN1324_c0_g1~~TRINITY_DN1324_c0_g1_i1.p2  ORF type:complete len:213 (+),score=35.54 TRINITY_DN1324_c0_g1_i1:118-756(+)